MMRMCSIASGSSGNCIYIGSDSTHLLVDAGISGKKIEEGVGAIGLKPSELDGILITHEHADHIAGLGVLSRKYHLPIYATGETIAEIKKSKSLGKLEEELFHEIENQDSFSIKDIRVGTVPISHDAVNPVAYRFQCEGRKMAVMTDLGTYDERIVDFLQKTDVLLLESNHDIRMLEVGPYPFYLKKRILGNRGHLCNEVSGQLLSKVLHDDLKAVLLGHLSRENNLPELAYETVRLEITNSSTPYKADDFRILVASRSEKSDLIEV